MFSIKLSVVLFLIWIFGVKSEDVFIMSEDICMTNSSLPIISNPPLKDINEINDNLYLKDKMYKNFDDGECGEFCFGSWSIEESNSEIIMDRRWEDLKTYFLQVDDKQLYFEPTNIDIPKKDFKIPMSIRGKEIHIFFCTDKTVTSKCVWFILQGWEQTKSAIKQCNENEIPTKLYKYPQNKCKESRNETVHTIKTLFLFEDHWSHIFVEKQNNTWSIIQNDKKIISFDGSNVDPHYKHLILHAKIMNALVKIHNNKYLTTKKEKTISWTPKTPLEIFCVKFFIKMCSKCSLEITLQLNRTTVFHQQYKESKWKEITIHLPKNISFYVLSLESNGVNNSFWAVDSISSCPENDIRKIPRQPESNCELIDGFGSQKLNQETYKNTKINTESNCTDDQLGFDDCFSCSPNICGPKKYCQLNLGELKCVCPPGSSVFNDECRKCSDGYYGIGCRRSCPGCKFGCEYNGKCILGLCNPYWKRDNCDTLIYPIFVNTPIVQDITPTTAKFIFNNFTLFGDDKESVDRYTIQLKEKSSFKWENIGQNDIGVNYDQVYYGLKPQTTYLVRATVDKYNNSADRYFEFNTTCIFSDTLSKLDYNLLSNEEDTEIQFNYKKCKQEGPLFVYAIITCLSKWCQNDTFKEAIKNISDDRKFIIRRLIPYTDYDVQMYQSRFSDGRNAFLFRENITTLESVPNKIRDLMVYSIETDKENYRAKISLRWLPPWPPQSRISHYKINYSFSNILCNSRCKIWENYICCTIDYEIYFGQKYTFNVTAIDNKNRESISEQLVYYIEQQTTSAPYKVITEWNDENKLKLSWTHPNFTYGGPITHFVYQINGISNTFNVREENLTYTNSNIDVGLEKEITILIKACNTECSGNTEKKEFSSPPNEIPSTSEKINFTMVYIALVIFSILIIIIIIIIIAVGIFMYLKFRRLHEPVSELGNVDLSTFAQNRGEILKLIPISTQAKKSLPIEFFDFEVYLKRSLQNGSLEEQYENSVNYLSNPVQKKEKDRIMGYPATKIFCENLNYLLTEAPTENSVNLFFKMVWQQHVSVIVAIVDDENEGKILCPGIYQSRIVEGMTITITSEENQPYVTLKRLKLAIKNKEKEICYIQLSNWVHSATFLYLNVISLLKNLNTVNNSNKQSILIYSGNEYSRSDIIIMSDICLKMARRDNHIDALKYFRIIKEKHYQFLDNFQKYKIVNLLILESMFRINTNISYEENFKEKMGKIISNNLEAQFKYLKDAKWIDELLGTETVSPIYTELLQFQTRTMADRTKYQIQNFVNVIGSLNKNQLYTMKEPTEKQKGFWRFVVDSNTKVIIVLKHLEDKDNNKFWPQRNDVITIDPTITITFVDSVNFDCYKLISLNIKVQQNNFPISLYVFTKWKILDSVPMKFKDAVSFINESASTLNTSDAIVFTCWDGNSGCGLFVGLYFLIEAIKSTKSCDVCHTVRYIRIFNRQFINNMIQFKFLYECSLESMLNFFMYDN